MVKYRQMMASSQRRFMLWTICKPINTTLFPNLIYSSENRSIVWPLQSLPGPAYHFGISLAHRQFDPIASVTYYYIIHYLSITFIYIIYCTRSCIVCIINNEMVILPRCPGGNASTMYAVVIIRVVYGLKLL